MADWYVSSTAWAAIPQFAASAAYTVGQIVRPLTAPAFSAQYAFRCTVAGTASTEPAWPSANNGTVTTGGVTFTNVSGQSVYGWGAAAGNAYAISNNASGGCRPAVGDRVFVSSDHSESSTNTTYQFPATSSFGVILFVSVNRAGAVPPGTADELSGAAISSTAPNFVFDNGCSIFWKGFTFNISGATGFQFNSANSKASYFKNCAFVLSSTSTVPRVTNNNPARIIFDNTTVQFSNTAQGFQFASYPVDFLWINTPSALQGATLPATLILVSSLGSAGNYTIRGVDLSALTGTLVLPGLGSTKVLLDSCRIASGLVRYGTPTTSTPPGDEVEFVNCYDGTNIINERHTAAGDITTDRNTYLTSGAQDDISNYSLKLISSSRSDFAAFPLDVFAFDAENTATGVSKTATVEVISSGTLNNNDIRLLLEYMGTSGNPIASFGDNLASVLTPAAALPSSSNNWNSPPATPQKQLLQVTFTPQRAGRVRGLVRLGKPATTVWVNPQMAIT